MARPISVFILSDNRLLRESLGRILSKRGDLKIVSSQGFSESTREEVTRSAADVILLDSPDFVCSGVSGARTQKESRGLRMLLVAMEEDEQVFLRAIRAGAMGFIPKDASSLDVVAAVRSVARGEAVCPPRFCKFLFDCISSPLKTPLEGDANVNFLLTRREQQLVPMIGQGLTNKEIAQQLNLSEQTIKNHVHRILQKIGVDSRMGIRVAIHNLSN